MKESVGENCFKDHTITPNKSTKNDTNLSKFDFENNLSRCTLSLEKLFLSQSLIN